MLASQIITNTWQCDNCGTQAVQELNPFFSISMSFGTAPLSTSCDMDLCQTCMKSINLEPIAAYVAASLQD